MINVGIAAVPNQTLSIQLNSKMYDITLRDANGIVSASISRDGTSLVKNIRVVAGTPILPYLYQEEGNFLMTTDADALPTYVQFGVTQFLNYITPDELAAYRAA